MTIAYFVDDSPAKLGKYVPRLGAQVLSGKDSENSLPDVFFILMPNHAEHFKKSEAEFANKGRGFIVSKAKLRLV